MSVQLARRPFTAAEYHRLSDVGILTEDDRVELLNGEIIKIAPIGPRHAACVDRLAEHLQNRIGKISIVRVQNPIRLDDYSEPEPDISILKRRSDYYARNHPSAADVLIAIEVADTTLESDRAVKLPSYARAGIPEVWLVDLNSDRIEVHTNPHADVYQEVKIVLRRQRVASAIIPQLKLKADDILG